MPTYVYECNACKSQFEIQQRITEDALTDCIRCEKKGTIKRLIQPVGVMFKGAGFHINDYAAKTPEDSSSAPAETKSESAAAPAEATVAAPSAAPAPATETK
jgi:putative FmdB family regulatory protein